ncbi:MAG: UDP-N-acetylglucosamine 2-epimerase (hydrolyzing), partial [Candidatus Heimdallarchaeota archaeon]|nr:UDP-N-acetylglucosamine 2-epimerase (hydrolyzing) [Candidatus Heimdallarchaeota archaeon]
GLMAIADVIIGNSSSGIIEAAALDLAVVNIGTRQRARERADYIIDVDYNKNEILKAIKLCLTKDYKAKIKNSINPYGVGDSSKKIVDLLASIDISRNMIEKI